MKNENILFYAFRYALGRKTYVVSDVVECLINNWDNLKEHTQERIIMEIKSAISKDNAGTECDVKEWNKILKIKNNV